MNAKMSKEMIQLIESKRVAKNLPMREVLKEAHVSPRSWWEWTLPLTKGQRRKIMNDWQAGRLLDAVQALPARDKRNRAGRPRKGEAAMRELTKQAQTLRMGY